MVSSIGRLFLFLLFFFSFSCLSFSQDYDRLPTLNVGSVSYKLTKPLLTINDIDFITARAVAPLTKLLRYSYKFNQKKTHFIFLKGKTVFNEIKIARNNFVFNIKRFKSITSDEGNILVIKNLKKK